MNSSPDHNWRILIRVSLYEANRFHAHTVMQDRRQAVEKEIVRNCAILQAEN